MTQSSCHFHSKAVSDLLTKPVFEVKSKKEASLSLILFWQEINVPILRLSFGEFINGYFDQLVSSPTGRH
jgi:hypothetical protein